MVPVISRWAVDGCCYFLVGSAWLLVFPSWLLMVVVIFWWALAGYCYFLVGFGSLLLILGGSGGLLYFFGELGMFAVIFW